MFFQGEAIFFNDLVDCFVAENAPRSDILRIAADSKSESVFIQFICGRLFTWSKRQYYKLDHG